MIPNGMLPNGILLKNYNLYYLFDKNILAFEIF